MSKSSQDFANALIERLHIWCMQLFWMTVVCVVKFCEDDEQDVLKRKRMLAGSEVAYHRKIEEIERKVLYHLTSSSSSKPVHRFVNIRQFSSRPPSLELFSIAEE